MMEAISHAARALRTLAEARFTVLEERLARLVENAAERFGLATETGR
jgi:hypothetical protein